MSPMSEEEMKAELEREMTTVQGSTPAGPHHEVSLHPTLDVMTLVMKCRSMLPSGLAGTSQPSSIQCTRAW